MKINCKKIAEEVKDNIKNRINSEKLNPTLKVIIVGNNSASRVYVRNKQKACEYVGINFILDELDENISQEELLKIIDNDNKNNNIDGILVQLPLPKHINEESVINKIDPKKDVDGFHPINIGATILDVGGIQPCTPKGIVRILSSLIEDFTGYNIVMVGRSNIVGKPLACIMINKGATVTVCNSKTKNLRSICKNADILIVAIGRAKYIDRSYVKNGSIVIDVGMNRAEDNKLCGDVDYESVNDVVSFITPVPGGVGPMTIAMLMENVLYTHINRKYDS